MKANELRLGNCLQDSKERFYQVNIDDLVYISEVGTKSKPIPLTEEWLLRFGFEWYGRITGWTINEHSVNEKYGCFEFCINKEFPVELKYVHQLQNLHFALTMEELILKL